MKTTLLFRGSMLFALLAFSATAAISQVIGIESGVPYPMNVGDTVTSPYLPRFALEEAGSRGFVKADGVGGFAFEDGTPARFFGVAVQLGACFPDSATAVATAGRLRKLGVNLVRFDYMDFSYSWAQVWSFLDVASGARSINEEQMKKFDWFVYQLKKNGVYSAIALQGGRASLPSDGMGTLADSTLWLGLGHNYLYPQARATHKLVSELLLNHVNPYTGKAYKQEPAIAMIDIWKQGSLLSLVRINYVNYVSGGYTFSWNHSRRLDTLYAEFLRKKYGTTAGLNQAWTAPVPQGGHPNRLKEGSFEGIYDIDWQIDAGDGTSLTEILTQDSVPDGKYAITLRTRNSQGNYYGAYMYQLATLGFDTVYQLIFKVKCSNPQGRSVVIYGNEANADGLYAGLSATVRAEPYWKEDTVTFLVPIRTTAPVQITFYFGDSDGEITFDDIRLRPFTPVSLAPGESLENSMITRIPWSNTALYLVNSKRVEDQTEFYITLDRDYLTDMKRYVSDTLGARQPVTGASAYWAGSFMEIGTQAMMDYAATGSGWDGVGSADGRYQVRNNSILRLYYYTPGIYEMAARAIDNQPMVASFAHPFPSRYQAETMLYLPAYSSLQGWDGIVWEIYLDNVAHLTTDHVDSAAWYQAAKNPSIISMMPAVAQLFRNGLVAQAEGTVRVRHSEQQSRLFPRMETFWSQYAIPGGINGYGMAITRIAIDSLNSSTPTQASDIAFPSQADGMVISDTREIEWNVFGGALTINTPKAQGASGYLGRSDDVMLDNLEIDLISGNESSTFLWVPVDADSRLSQPGRSLLVVASRTEPTGMRWLDTSYADVWGAGPMLIDPVRATLTFTFDTDVKGVELLPLDGSGMPIPGGTIVANQSGRYFTATIDQRATRAMWYAVIASTSTTAAPGAETGTEIGLSVYPNVVSERAFVEVSLPEARNAVDVEVYDGLGRKVATLRRGEASQGATGLRLDCRELPVGTYHVRLRTERGEIVTRSLSVAR